MRHLLAPEHRRPGEVRVLQQAVDEGLLVARGVVAHDSWHKTGDGLYDDEGRRLAAREHVVADRQVVVDDGPHSLVDALVTAAQE